MKYKRRKRRKKRKHTKRLYQERHLHRADLPSLEGVTILYDEVGTDANYLSKLLLERSDKCEN